MISPQTIQQITNRIDIIDVVGEFIKLKKRGANYLGLCPFHGEKTPSFTVSPSKEIFKCFGCGKSGNTITFLMEHEKYSYAEALRWLAHRYNIEIEETEMTDDARQQLQIADSLYIINNFAQKFFTEQLTESEEGRNIALSYLEERGFNKEIITKFQLGYNPQARNTFAKAALQQQYNADLLLKTGLVTNKYEELTDNYRGRIIFPIHNNTGKVIGFGARVIGKADKAPKYINTPENELYVKNRILYGSYFARQSIDKQNECLLVEGYTDVISLHQAGIENVVASGGTSLTTEQLRLVKKYTNNLTIIYDGDAAGVKASLRGLDMALEESLNVKLVLIPDNEDPDGYVNKIGSEAFKNFIATNKKDFILFQLKTLLKEAGNDIEQKNTVVNRIAETLSKISRAEDFTRQQEYIRQCSDLLKIDEQGLTSLVNKYKRDKVTKEEKKSSSISNIPLDALIGDMPLPQEDEATFLLQQGSVQERDILRVLLESGLNPYNETDTIASYIFKELEEFHFDNLEYKQLLEEYRKMYNQGLNPDIKTFQYHDTPAMRKLVTNITIFPFELSSKWKEMLGNKAPEDDGGRYDAHMSLCYFKLRKIKKMFTDNQHAMEQASSFEKQFECVKIHNELKKVEISLTKELGSVIVK